MANPTVGLVGLGQMGAPIAGHILKGGYQLLAYDLEDKRRSAAEKLGAQACPTLADVGRNSDLVIVMVGYDNEVWEVCCGDGALVDAMRPGSTIVIMSTITVQ